MLQAYDHAISILTELHRLPVKYRIECEVAVTTFKVITTSAPNYMADISPGFAFRQSI